MTPHTPTPCQGIECVHFKHASDCAVHNEPAYPTGPCDCRKPTAIPWKVCPNESIIRKEGAPLEEYHVAQTFGPDAKANAAFIVRACNAYQGLLDCLKNICSVECPECGGEDETHIDPCSVKDAIANAEGQS